MAYKLNKTDGSLLVELVDGRLDTTSADINLIGKNYQGFGESINENFIKILENFSNTTAPSNPIKGQLWYDTATARLKVYDGITFRSTDSTIYSATQPTELIEGDIWIDGSKDQVFFWNGTEVVLVGPAFDKTQSTSGDVVETIKDTLGQNRTVIKRYINGSLVGIETKVAFTPAPTIPGFGELQVGFNISASFTSYKFLGAANSAKQLIDDLGNVYDQSSFLSTSNNSTTTGSITIKDDNGLFLGDDLDVNLRQDGAVTNLRMVKSNQDFKIAFNNGNLEDSVYIDSSEKKVGFFQSSLPVYTVDIAGDLRVTGNILVEGDSVSLDVAKLRVEDHRIELAIQDDSTLISETDLAGLEAANGPAGIVVRVSGDDKEWAFYTGSNAWTSSHDIALLKDADSYYIGANNVLSRDTLGSTVENSSLRTVGKLINLTVGPAGGNTMTITEDTISTTAGLQITSVDAIELTNPKQIKNVADPTDNGDVTNKSYVDDAILQTPVVFGVDITGLGTTYNPGTYGDGTCDDGLLVKIATMLSEISPPTTQRNGTVAKIHAYYTTATTDPIDVQSGITKTLTAVDSAGVQNVNVVGDFAISDPTATVTLTVTRRVITMTISSSLWDVNGSTIATSAV
jgi:hypothetical protein